MQKYLASQSSYFKFWPHPVILGGVRGWNGKSCETLRVERSGWNLVERIFTNPRYVIDIAGLNPLSLGMGEGVRWC